VWRDGFLINTGKTQGSQSMFFSYASFSLCVGAGPIFQGNKSLAWLFLWLKIRQGKSMLATSPKKLFGYIPTTTNIKKE
jgi:hypothetical protein